MLTCICNTCTYVCIMLSWALSSVWSWTTFGFNLIFGGQGHGHRSPRATSAGQKVFAFGSHTVLILPLTQSTGPHWLSTRLHTLSMHIYCSVWLLSATGDLLPNGGMWVHVGRTFFLIKCSIMRDQCITFKTRSLHEAPRQHVALRLRPCRRIQLYSSCIGLYLLSFA